MLHPKKGEGEHRSIIRKGPQLLTAALLIATPICMAQAASVGYANERTSLLLSQTQAQKGLVPQSSSFLSQSLQTKWSSNFPNSTDIDTLESTLSSYKSQLATLRAKTPKDPKVQATLDAAISALESDIKTLEDALTNLRASFQLLTKNKLTLSSAVEAYNQAIAAKTKATQELDAATSSRLLTLNTKSEKQNNLDTLSTALTTAQTANDNAAAEVATATLLLDRATSALSKATTNRQTAQADYDAAAQLLDTKLQLKSSKQAAFEAAVANYETYIQNTGNAVRNLSAKELSLLQAQSALEVAQQEYEQSDSALTTISSELSLRQAEYDSAHESTQQVVAEYQQLIDTYTTVYNNYLAKQSAFQTAQANLNTAQQNLNTAQSNYDNNLIPDPTWIAPTQQVPHTRLVPNTRQVEVRTLVPRTVSQVTGGILAEVFNRNGYNNAPPMPYAGETPFYTTTVPNINFNWGGGQVLGSGYSEDIIVRFTGNLVFPTSGYYRFYTPADDGTKLSINGVELIDDWYDKGGGGTVSEPIYIEANTATPFVLHYYENGGGAAVWFYTYTDQTGFEIIPAAHMGTTVQETTVYDEVITYEQETYYTEETYYTTEPVLTQGTVYVDIGEGGQATFTAPAGAVFIAANLRYESYNNPTCGIDINEILQSGTESTLTSITLAANNDVWGDSCGGQVKHLVGTLTYLGQPTAPLIHDPALLPALQNAQTEYDSALTSYNIAESEWNQAQVDQQVAAQATTDGYYLVIGTAESENNAYATLQQVQTQYSSQLQITNQSQSELSSAQSEVASAQQEVTNANNVLTDASAAEADAQAHYESTKAEHEAAIEEADLALTAKTTANSTLLAATDILSTATSEEQSASTVLASKQTDLGNANALLLQATTNKDLAATELQQATTEADTAEANFQTATVTLNAADLALTTATTNKTASEEEVTTAEVSLTNGSEAVQKVSNISFGQVEELLNKEPESVVEEGSKEIPAVLTAENLLEVDLSAVDPTELTEAQAEQLVEAALETFETAEAGSPEYEQALDALYLAAEQDDIELPEELAAIPGLAGAVEVLNFLGNAGADMSPKVREESEKVVVATVIAAGAAIQAATGAATSAAVSAGASTGSSGSRRIGK